MILSCFNIDKHLSAFYKKEGKEQYIPLVKQHSLELYLYFLKNSLREDFIECCKGILDDSTVENILIQHSELNERTKDIKTPNKICSFFIWLKLHLKRRFRR